ncbi:hypothetical protein ASPSYDRAFT_725714 [Aspergillus sydowii CBS 593.65]|uniref:Uncharacterized protein n=1 Tax=Aspergillus sydowii CBS 593.65 TaxID=1036612 RepID=A0A1L9SXY9_9EURO|nr:uncharacterized protein ASPSYDRAFT_725714 [Aspergillus sydowii CBS 593.65]OJJ52016.1 hypothetical protein ASPSYDRAFT_725714 [Aspergillus sydowii CBS 593.65]
MTMNDWVAAYIKACVLLLFYVPLSTFHDQPLFYLLSFKPPKHRYPNRTFETIMSSTEILYPSPTETSYASPVLSPTSTGGPVRHKRTNRTSVNKVCSNRSRDSSSSFSSPARTIASIVRYASLDATGANQRNPNPTLLPTEELDFYLAIAGALAGK